METLLALQQSGHTIIIVSHEIDKVLAHADQVLVLEAGMVAVQGTKHSVFEHLEDHGMYVPKTSNVEDLTWLKH
nr:hypothetical protein [uncultured Sphaerochaeta sp.]